MFGNTSSASPPAGGRKAARSAATRAQLISVATRLFAERGYAGVGTEEIVREAGVSRGALYHHFADKRELFAAVHERLEEQVTQRIMESGAGLHEPWALILNGMRAYLDACTDQAVGRITLIEAPAVLGWQEWREIDARHGLRLLSTALQVAMDAGLLAEQPVEPLAQLLLAAMAEAGLMVATAADPGSARRSVEGPL
ncbi:MAG: TetR/AcrR family transcriptional regulator, partial [Candidatus Dormibacteraeota bacterium]|nr:TetR/AcrR family transcriptional regulator [Candidatus Dormibacteraeota bacterium]